MKANLESKIRLHLACHYLSQYELTETLSPILAVRLAFTYDLEYSCKRTFIFLQGGEGKHKKCFGNYNLNTMIFT